VASPTSGYSPLLVHFDGSTSQDPDGSITSYSWDFKDGNTAKGAVVDHLFTTSGTFEVSLTVTDDANQSSKTSVAISVGALQYTVFFRLGQGLNDPNPDEVMELIVEGQTRCRTPLGGECESGGINLTEGDHVIGVKLIEDTGASGGSADGTRYHVWMETNDAVEIIPPEKEGTVNGVNNTVEFTITLRP
jgi:PKD repeat protein